jgi:hypothetical protein
VFDQLCSVNTVNQLLFSDLSPTKFAWLRYNGKERLCFLYKSRPNVHIPNS